MDLGVYTLFHSNPFLVGGYFNHLGKYESQWEGLSHILWKIKNVPNHQPAFMCVYISYNHIL
jgi:hypothetical protein